MIQVSGAGIGLDIPPRRTDSAGSLHDAAIAGPTWTGHRFDRKVITIRSKDRPAISGFGPHLLKPCDPRRVVIEDQRLLGAGHMKLQQLKYLLAIVDNGLNITAAAERMYTSQPGVSKQLKLLEEELGVKLFVRKGKSLNGITLAGHQVISRARAIMREVEEIRLVAKGQHREQRSHVQSPANHHRML